MSRRNADYSRELRRRINIGDVRGFYDLANYGYDHGYLTKADGDWVKEQAAKAQEIDKAWRERYSNEQRRD